MKDINFLTADFLFGTLFTCMFAISVSEFMKKIIVDFGRFTAPKEIDSEIWNKAFGIREDKRKFNIYIGLFESILFFISFYTNQPQLIGSWLAFKLASKWQTWNAIMKIPEKLEGYPYQVEYIGAKNEIAWFTLQRWLVGTLANIVAGLGGLIVGQLVSKILIHFYTCHMSS